MPDSRRSTSPVGQLRLAAIGALAALLFAAGCTDVAGPPITAPLVPSAPSALLVPGQYTGVSAGLFHSCGISGGLVACWGRNEYGQSTVPAGLAGVTQVSGGAGHTCALRAGGTVTCWGSDSNGQSSGPAGIAGVSQVEAGFGYTCALAAGTVSCWGGDDFGQSTVPPGLGAVSQVSTGDLHACAVVTGGTVTCWGWNFNGRAAVPAGLTGVSQVSAGGEHTCALLTNGTVTCWGISTGGNPLAVPAGLSGVTQISTGYNHACALGAGTVTCWGEDNGFPRPPVPADVTGVSEVSAGGFHSCAVLAGGSVRCWVRNEFGQSDVPTAPLTGHVLPIATFGAPAAATVGQSFTLSLTDAQVPGYPAATTFTYAFDCGGGTYGAASATNSASCPTNAVGTRSVRGKVIDQDGDFTEYTASVSVLSVAQAATALRTQVASSTLIPDLRRALTVKLDAALAALAAGKTKNACSALGDFANQVRAQRGKAIPVATADAWLAQVAALRSAAGC